MSDYQCSACSDRAGALNGGIHCNLCCDQLKPCSEHCSAKIFREAKPGDLIAYRPKGVGSAGKKITLEVVENQNHDRLVFSDGSTISRTSITYLDHYSEPSFLEKITKKDADPTLLDKLVEALAQTKISRRPHESFREDGALKILAVITEVLDKANVEVPNGYESYTWVEEKCPDAYCGKAKNHTGQCTDDAFADKKFPRQRDGVRPISLSQSVKNILRPENDVKGETTP